MNLDTARTRNGIRRNTAKQNLALIQAQYDEAYENNEDALREYDELLAAYAELKNRTTAGKQRLNKTQEDVIRLKEALDQAYTAANPPVKTLEQHRAGREADNPQVAKAFTMDAKQIADDRPEWPAPRPTDRWEEPVEALEEKIGLTADELLEEAGKD